jgi:hypothetical protein
VDEGPKIAWVVESCIEELAGICGQIDDADLRKKNIKDIKISGLAWVKEAVCRKSCVPVVESDGEIAEAVSEPVADNEVLGVLDDTIDEVTEAANPSELRLPAVRGSSIVSSSGGYESFDIGVAFETRKKLKTGREELAQPILWWIEGKRGNQTELPWLGPSWPGPSPCFVEG